MVESSHAYMEITFGGESPKPGFDERARISAAQAHAEAEASRKSNENSPQYWRDVFFARFKDQVLLSLVFAFFVRRPRFWRAGHKKAG